MNKKNENEKIELINFTNSQPSEKIYPNGSMSKYGIIYEDKNYMVKEQENKVTHYVKMGWFSPTYLSNVFSEYIASNIALNLGLKSQKTLLGFVSLENNEKKLVVACEDFLNEREQIFDFKEMVKETQRKNKKRNDDVEYYLKTKTLKGILQIIQEQNFVDPIELKEHFWQMFVFDAYIGNFDRNATNWGLVKSNRSGKNYYIAPIFDNGSCLHPKTPRELIKNYLEKAEQDESFLENASIFSLSSSVEDIDNKRIKYIDFFKNSENIDFLYAINKLYPKIIKNHEKNLEIIQSLDEVMEKDRVQLLVKEMNYRLVNMFKPVYEKSLNYIKDFIQIELDKKVKYDLKIKHLKEKYKI